MDVAAAEPPLPVAGRGVGVRVGVGFVRAMLVGVFEDEGDGVTVTSEVNLPCWSRSASTWLEGESKSSTLPVFF